MHYEFVNGKDGILNKPKASVIFDLWNILDILYFEDEICKINKDITLYKVQSQKSFKITIKIFSFTGNFENLC